MRRARKLQWAVFDLITKDSFGPRKPARSAKLNSAWRTKKITSERTHGATLWTIRTETWQEARASAISQTCVQPGSGQNQESCRVDQAPAAIEALSDEICPDPSCPNVQIWRNNRTLKITSELSVSDLQELQRLRRYSTNRATSSWHVTTAEANQ